MLSSLNNGVPISWYLMLSAVLFALGVAGFLFRRNIITVFMSIELMLNAVNLSFVTFSYQHQAGQRPHLRVLRDGGGGGRSGGGPGHHPDGVQEPRDVEHRRSQFAEELTDAELWLIPALPFVGFLINGIFGRKFPKAVINADRRRQRGRCRSPGC